MNYINPIEPPTMDIEKVKKEYGDKIALWGNIDLIHTLPHGTVEEVEAEVKERIKKISHCLIKSLGQLHVDAVTSIFDIRHFAVFQTFFNPWQVFGPYPGYLPARSMVIKAPRE